jgi:hypothetical protein
MNGIAHGWEGAAWVALQQIRAGHRAWTDELACELIHRLSFVDDRRPGQLLGLGGAATVAALAAAIDPELAALRDRVIARWSETTCEVDDVFAGHPGALLAIAEIGAGVPAAFIDRCYARTRKALARMLETDRHLLGFAHGLAGLLVAVEVGGTLRSRDDELIARAFDRLVATRMIAPSLGTLWAPWTDGLPADVTGSWCHGIAGIALALAICSGVTGEDAYRELLDEVAPDRLPCAGPTFCCGRSGTVQALIEVFRQTGEPSWFERAQRMAITPVAMTLSAEFPDGFTQGGLGLEYVEARLRDPFGLALPACGSASHRANGDVGAIRKPGVRDRHDRDRTVLVGA